MSKQINAPQTARGHRNQEAAGEELAFGSAWAWAVLAAAGPAWQTGPLYRAQGMQGQGQRQLRRVSMGWPRGRPHAHTTPQGSCRGRRVLTARNSAQYMEKEEWPE